MNQGGGQQNLTTDRSLIGTKELNYLTDFMSWELLAMKKCNEAATGVMDKNIANTIQEAGRRHQAHYNAILQHLQ
ncbi:MAG: hypothetical protein H7X86_12645 [Gorillibacterium sp.]|nr:hypothetical protein [Gorillibacterium sp.]